MSFMVLVIEDEENIRTTRFDLENDFDCELVTAETADDARSSLINERFDLILVDVQIPGNGDGDLLDFGGLEVIASLHAGELGQLNTQTSYLILTAQRSSLSREKVTKDSRCLGVVRKISQSDAIDIIGGYFARQKTAGGSEDFSGSRNR